MSDAIPLPPRPNLEQYKKLAKDFQHACNSADSGAIREWATHWLEDDAEARRMEHRWKKFKKTERCKLTDAQFFIARNHGFATWPKFTAHLKALSLAHSPISNFETAADAIISGDAATLANLLRDHPALARARSTRDHRSTLLHYVSANGIEDYRQKTPKNIVEITTLLLDSGADVNAESDAYGGRSTTLGLTATSCHPEEAGVQLALLQLLIDRGALIDGPDSGSAVNGCLHNGRGQAAEFLATRGASLDLEAAAGVGRLDVVQSFFNTDGTLKPAATEKQLTDGFAWACEFGHLSVVEFLLRQGVDVEAKLRHNGQTGLHWAAWGGLADIVKLLLERGARVDVKDETYESTPLEWALYRWGASPDRTTRPSHYATVALLARAGAELDPRWPSGDPERQRTIEKIRTDPRMAAALRGELPTTSE